MPPGDQTLLGRQHDMPVERRLRHEKGEKFAVPAFLVDPVRIALLDRVELKSRSGVRLEQACG